MITSRFTPRILLTRSSSFALPSGLSAYLSKSKKVSAANVTFSLTGAGGGGGGGGGGGATGAGAGAAACTGFNAPSQRWSAVAGDQTELRQQYSLVPFFQ